jgi:dihydropteroate synthase
VDEELRRVLPVIRTIRERFPDAVLSIDTVKSETARAALREGASIVNDVSGFRLDSAMAGVCADAGAGVVLMHSRGDIETMATYAQADYSGDPMTALLSELRARVDVALAAGLERSQIAVDPGIGFSKRAAHSLRALGALARLVEWGHPVLVGASRKRFIGEITGVSDASQRVFGSVGAALAAYERGAHLFRVHDVAATRQALDVAAAVRGAGAA